MADTGDVRVVYQPEGADEKVLYNPREDSPLLKTVVMRYLSPQLEHDGVDAAIIRTSGNSPESAAKLGKLVAATSIFLVLKELAPHVKNAGEEWEDEQHDGIPAQDADGCFTSKLEIGVLKQHAHALSFGATGHDNDPAERDDVAASPAPVEVSTAWAPLQASKSHIVRLPCTPQRLINPYMPREVVVLALNRFMTPVLLSVTAPVIVE